MQIISDVLNNLKRMLALAWQMDRKVVLGYYFTAMLGAMAPLAAGVTLKLYLRK